MHLLSFRLLSPFSWLAVCCLLGLACGSPQTSVQLDAASVRTLHSRVSEAGVIQPTIEVPIAPDVSGEVVFIGVKEGQKVNKGDLLITIQPDDYRAVLEQSEASLSRAKADYLRAKAAVAEQEARVLQDSLIMKRNMELFEEKVVSKLDLENSQTSYKVSRSKLESARYQVQASFYQVKTSEASRKQARQNLDRTNIYSSIDGTITSLDVEIGQRVVGTSQMAGTEILKIADLAKMEVVVEVNENDIVNVNLGDSATVEIDAYPGEFFYGEVMEIAYSANVTGAASADQVTNFEVKVEVSPASYQHLAQNRQEESPFRPGMTALVEVFTQMVENAVVVPIQAVTLRKSDSTKEEESEVVFRYDGARVVQVPVKTGISDDQYIEISQGLEKETKIVVGPYQTLSERLRDGMEVTTYTRRAKK
ncbi:MAG: efflux RND transporter periplasmic adaptor subunit [Bacteroidota bacterium]